MIAFEDSGGQVVLAYSPEQSGPSWLDDKLDSEGEATLLRTFTVRKDRPAGSGRVRTSLTTSTRMFADS